MALTNCKECNQEVSAEAKICPHCGIEYPGVIETNYRLAGFVVLGLIIILGIYLFNKHERVGYQATAISEKNVNNAADKAKAVQSADSAESSSEQSNPAAAPVNEATTPPQQSAVQTTPQPAIPQEPVTVNESISTPDTPQTMVIRMLEYASIAGGIGHESEIQQIKLQIESSPRPAKGNKKAAKVINAKGLAFSQKGDFNNAVKMFEEANKLDPSDIEIVNNLGFSYLKLGNLESAQQTIILALTMSPDRASAWENLGEVFGAKADIKKAFACFSNTYRFSKDRLKIHQYLQKLNEKETVENVKQARAKAIKWAEDSYLNFQTK